MTAIDAATQARRLGAGEVTLVYRRTQAEMPCTRAELDIARADGCRIVWLAAPKTIVGDNGRVRQLVCSVMEPGPPDSSGRAAPVDTGRTLTLDVDMVIKAAGQMPFQTLVAGENIAHTQGRITIDGSCATNIPGVFAGGDNVNGGKEVVDAVQAGKNAAAAILNFIDHG
jgi:glutamate synthase (NADPH/NADH) small chain